MSKSTDTGANLAFESRLWQAADALRSNTDAAEYKHVAELFRLRGNREGRSSDR